MALSNAYVYSYGRIPQLLASIRDGQAPAQFTQQLLKDLGLTSSSDRAFLPLLKAIGFLTPDGKPTPQYHDYRDHSKSAQVLGSALREAYSDIFLIKAKPTADDREAIQGKFKSYHNCTDQVAKLMTNTFLALLQEADISGKASHVEIDRDITTNDTKKLEQNVPSVLSRSPSPSLHYNIQIHLPATKDIEVYNAIFKSIKEHLINE
jgi:hypothetical protein